jgi:tripartite-type tricarboxylate transporter receptor subunit TctC
MKTKRIMLATLALCAIMSRVDAVQAADFPIHSVRLLVGFAPGGGTDTIARLLAQKLSDLWHQPVVVENRDGADGTIAEDVVAHAAPDGYTIIMVINNHTIAPNQRKLPYDAVKAFAPISLVASSPMVLAVPPSLGVKTLKDFITLAKKEPGALNFGTSGTGTMPYLTMELFMHLTGTNMVNVSYKGSNLAQVALLGGEVQSLFGSITNYVELQKAGKVNVLAVSSKDRAAIMPNVPSIAEAAGVDYDVSGWYGVLAPAATPPDVVAKLHDSIVAAANTPAMRKSLVDQGFTYVASTPEAFDAVIRKEITEWGQLLKSIKSN